MKGITFLSHTEGTVNIVLYFVLFCFLFSFLFIQCQEHNTEFLLPFTTLNVVICLCKSLSYFI